MLLPKWSEKMKAARKEKKLSVQALADLSGVSHGTLERMENGHAPTLNSIEAVTRALGMSVSKFFE